MFKIRKKIGKCTRYYFKHFKLFLFFFIDVFKSRLFEIYNTLQNQIVCLRKEKILLMERSLVPSSQDRGLQI